MGGFQVCMAVADRKWERKWLKVCVETGKVRGAKRNAVKREEERLWRKACRITKYLGIIMTIPNGPAIQKSDISSMNTYSYWCHRKALDLAHRPMWKPGWLRKSTWRGRRPRSKSAKSAKSVWSFTLWYNFACTIRLPWRCVVCCGQFWASGIVFGFLPRVWPKVRGDANRSFSLCCIRLCCLFVRPTSCFFFFFFFADWAHPRSDCLAISLCHPFYMGFFARSRRNLSLLDSLHLLTPATTWSGQFFFGGSHPPHWKIARPPQYLGRYVCQFHAMTTIGSALIFCTSCTLCLPRLGPSLPFFVLDWIWMGRVTTHVSRPIRTPAPRHDYHWICRVFFYQIALLPGSIPHVFCFRDFWGLTFSFTFHVGHTDDSPTAQYVSHPVLPCGSFYPHAAYHLHLCVKCRRGSFQMGISRAKVYSVERGKNTGL